MTLTTGGLTRPAQNNRLTQTQNNIKQWLGYMRKYDEYPELSKLSMDSWGCHLPVKRKGYTALQVVLDFDAYKDAVCKNTNAVSYCIGWQDAARAVVEYLDIT